MYSGPTLDTPRADDVGVLGDRREGAGSFFLRRRFLDVIDGERNDGLHGRRSSRKGGRSLLRSKELDLFAKVLDISIEGGFDSNGRQVPVM